jgi:hypothetical protein
VLSDVGCNQPALDEHDARIIDETLHGSAQFRGDRTGLPGLPDSEQNVGGWEHYPEERRAEDWDSDHDGMPNWWEEAHHFDPRSSADNFAESNADADGDGYTNLEGYLNWMAEPHFECRAGTMLEVDLATLALGFTKKPEFVVTSPKAGDVTMGAGASIARFTPSGETTGLAGFSFDVRDAQGTTMTRSIGVRVIR